MFRFPSFWQMLGAFLVHVSAFVTVLLVIWALVGCSAPKIEYRPVPAILIPSAPVLPTVEAVELACLSDDAYLRLAGRDRALRQYAAELAALLGLRDAGNN